ncbi:molybdopterin-dependent oxidoreductase [Chitinophaga agrisoli]|uniref:Molybdopterin-dependent oxidoreductase n=1 Tax=Chitinophaga agrisoli TaxID=2607653 RepID=A0A5B2VIE7_9BACT|nr:nitrate reductase [Chitinophaga agrisoli]KAA2239353.1 molybdopterin-dependent oxidoreductase [Chitinophaga agrisoli]
MQASRDSIIDIWGERSPYRGEWPVRVDQCTSEEPDHWVQSACVLCSNGCGIDIGVKNGRIVGVRGRKEDIVNFGRMGPKGLHGWVANNSKDRLTKPLIRENGKLREAGWDEAMNLIVQRSKEIIEKQTSLGIGFYTSGQLFLEEYYTLGVIGKAGLGTPHMDGNTRLCTATSAAALKASFGSDGQPGSYSDIDTTDCVLHFGHNIASQQTVLWMRILDRLAGPNPPKVVVIDPRETYTAQKATVHLAPKPGTNIPVMNGLLHLIITAGHINRAYIDAHTVGFEELEKIVTEWPPERVEKLSGVPAAKLREAARILGTTRSLVSTVLQGVYQSMQATAAAVQINNLHLVRGLIGSDGCGIYQMNGQPTAQNTRECGADGDLPAFRNWSNKEHVQQLAGLWNVELHKIPHWSPPTHAMQIWRFAEAGSIKMLWISGTNPAVSMPELSRIREILQKEDLFVVAQDAFMTETTKFADVVLPAAIWGEKTGCYTNVDRTVHISHKAVEPPGEARSDFDIFIDYSRRMGFKDKDGADLIKWNTPEEAFEAWKECTRGRPCDYTGMSYSKLTGGSGIQWPCNEKFPEGSHHLYTDGVFNTAADYCETYGHDLDTGAAVTQEEYKAIDPNGKAFLKGSDYIPPHEAPDEEYPLWLTTGRLVYHFHTRTKTGRSKELHEAAPDGYVQISEEDAAKYNIAEGDMIEVASRRGKIVEPAKIGGIGPGIVFVPFHYGYWDNEERPRAANELTITEWDAVSKQPHFKYAAVKISKTGGILDKIGEAIETIKEKFKPGET